MTEDPFLFRTGSTVISVPAERMNALFGRLERTEEGKLVADELRRRNAVSSDKKLFLLRTLEEWMADTGVSDMGGDLNLVRYEMMRDLKIQPFDR